MKQNEEGKGEKNWLVPANGLSVGKFAINDNIRILRLSIFSSSFSFSFEIIVFAPRERERGEEVE